MVRALLNDVDLVAGSAEKAILTVANATLQASTVPGAVPAAQANHLIANNAGEAGIAHTPPGGCA